eukprot:TRINITY_DN5629_c0_g2_i7.p1 TRINITY_DN5629_c0_g2~~TRINITY_DN5629_c0_g2_i7.p1  ORF type:complete len:1049 (+),score=294.50 TRINITY_DN5629_c0_g2_i7:87-3233(+)
MPPTAAELSAWEEEDRLRDHSPPRSSPQLSPQPQRHASAGQRRPSRLPAWETPGARQPPRSPTATSPAYQQHLAERYLHNRERQWKGVVSNSQESRKENLRRSKEQVWRREQYARSVSERARRRARSASSRSDGSGGSSTRRSGRRVWPLGQKATAARPEVWDELWQTEAEYKGRTAAGARGQELAQLRADMAERYAEFNCRLSSGGGGSIRSSASPVQPAGPPQLRRTSSPNVPGRGSPRPLRHGSSASPVVPRGSQPQRRPSPSPLSRRASGSRRASAHAHDSGRRQDEAEAIVHGIFELCDKGKRGWVPRGELVAAFARRSADIDRACGRPGASAGLVGPSARAAWPAVRARVVAACGSGAAAGARGAPRAPPPQRAAPAAQRPLGGGAGEAGGQVAALSEAEQRLARLRDMLRAAEQDVLTLRASAAAASPDGASPQHGANGAPHVPMTTGSTEDAEASPPPRLRRSPGHSPSPTAPARAAAPRELPAACQQQQQQQQPPQQDSRTPPPPPASILAVAGRDRSTAAAQSAPAAVEAQQAPARPPPESPREARPEMAIHEGVELVHIWRDKAETAFGGTWQNTGKDKVLLSRVQPGCLAEQTVSAYIGRQCVAITNCQMTREVKDKEDIISAMQGHRGFVLQFRPMATGEAPTVPEGVPTRSLTKAAGAAHSLRKRLASKAGSLGEKTLSDICEIACTGAPENWFEEVRRVLCMAKEENRHIREKELLKMLFKGIGWEECPLALTEEELCVLASATLFAQRRTDAEVTQGLRSALGVTGSDEEYEQRVQEREAKARQQELARQRKKEEERQRLVECQKRLEERLKQIGDATPESPAQLPPPPAAPAQPAAAKPDAERSSPPPAPTAPAGRYKLSDTWAFWHNGRRGLQQLHAGISTLEDFWRVVNNIPAPSTLLPGDSYSFFRHDSAGVPIRPAPDADANGGGGAWRAQLQGGGAKLDTAWQRLLCSAVGGTLPSSSAVCGVAVERGKGERVGDTVALWLSTVDNEVCSSVEDSFRGATGVTDGAAEFAPHQASPAGGSAGEESP